MSKTLRTPSDLVEAGLVAAERHAEMEAVAKRYAVALPPALTALIDSEDENDPIARQIVPDAAELDLASGELADPIGDDAHSPVEGIVHRYPDRVLLKLTHICAVYCRFCFRREKVGPGKAESLRGAVLDNALRYIRDHDAIWEVILTGGDPLVLSPRRLRSVMKALVAVEHVKVVRIHTRLPIAAPALITADLIRAIKTKGKAIYVAVHVNHARELTPEARAALARMADAGLVLLGQSVLLKGVNDSLEALSDLMRACVESRVKPYYLHHCDLAPGTTRTRTSIQAGQQLMRRMRGRFSGLCQPTYVLDIPGGHGKSPIGPNYIETSSGGAGNQFAVEDFRGGRHLYPPGDKCQG